VVIRLAHATNCPRDAKNPVKWLYQHGLMEDLRLTKKAKIRLVVNNVEKGGRF
jgi:hypothetical protein